jgi:hypothetical protein
MAGAQLTNATLGTVAVPVIGVRYWLNPMIGIDAGLGFAMTSGSATLDQQGAASQTADAPGGFAWVLHAGLPIALLNMKHYSFQITPEIDVGGASRTTKRPGLAPAPGLPDLTESGFLVQAGGRAGAEIFFGFMGLPQLSLDASVGLFLASRSGKTDNPAGNGPGVTTKGSQMVIGTSQIHSPWDIFRENVAARYYF